MANPDLNALQNLPLDTSDKVGADRRFDYSRIRGTRSERDQLGGYTRTPTRRLATQEITVSLECNFKPGESVARFSRALEQSAERKPQSDHLGRIFSGPVSAAEQGMTEEERRRGGNAATLMKGESRTVDSIHAMNARGHKVRRDKHRRINYA